MPKSEFGSMQQVREQSAQICDEYGRIRDSNNYEIERLRAEANFEHQQMLECFERVSECYFGDKSEASYWSQQGHDHMERRDELNEEVRRLCEEVKADNQRERDRVLDRAGVRWSEREDAKIVKKPDGTTQ